MITQSYVRAVIKDNKLESEKFVILLFHGYKVIAKMDVSSFSLLDDTIEFKCEVDGLELGHIKVFYYEILEICIRKGIEQELNPKQLSICII